MDICIFNKLLLFVHVNTSATSDNNIFIFILDLILARA